MQTRLQRERLSSVGSNSSKTRCPSPQPFSTYVLAAEGWRQALCLHFFYVANKQSRHHEISDVGAAMRVGFLPFGLVALLGLSACSAIQNSGQDQPTISIELDTADPAKSEGTLQSKPTPVSYQVGYGKYGIACADTSFREGETPLGRFKVNAILVPTALRWTRP